MRYRSLLVTVVALEIASGLPFGVVQDLAPLWLRVHGVDLATLGAMGLVGLPWTLKALWAPVVDRTGSFRRWIAVGLAGCTIGVAALAWLARGEGLPPVPALLALLAFVAFASATQDVALDGWMAQVTPEDARGPVTGARVSAYRGAMALAGGGAAWLGDRLGWSWGFGAGALALACVGLVVTRLPSPPARAAQPSADWGRELLAWLATPGSAALFAFMLLYKLGDAAMTPMTRPFLLSTGLSAGEVGLVTSTAGAVLVSVGALAGGAVLERIGLRSGVWLLGGLQAVSNLAYAGAATLAQKPIAIAAACVESLSTGLGTAASLAVVMTASAGGGGRHAATRFAALTTMAGITRTVAGAISGLGVEQLGYASWFALTFLFALPALALVPWITPREGPR